MWNVQGVLCLSEPDLQPCKRSMTTIHIVASRITLVWLLQDYAGSTHCLLDAQ